MGRQERLLSSSCRINLEVIRKAERVKAKGILIAPDWLRSSFYSLVEERVKKGRMEFLEGFSPVLTCPREIVSNTFRGVLKFLMNVYKFRF